MVEAVNGEGLTIAATGIDWPVAQSVDYARFAESAGADALQILRPYKFEQVSSGKWQNLDLNEKEEAKDVANLEGKNAGIDEDEYIVNYLRAVAKETRLPLVYHGRYTNDLLKKMATIDQLVAAKDDYQIDFYIKGLIEYGNRFEIFSGGEEYRYLVGYPYGARSFYATFTGFAPDIPMRFWRATLDGDLRKAVEITKQYDYVFIKNFTHPLWHATLEYFGVAQRYLRKPYETYTEAQMQDVKKMFDNMDLYPRNYLQANA
jgi:dihydrodipicolinate synthase/N-acetylneuraminate lyase